MAGKEEEKIVTAAVLIIGNEILSGRTKDVNLGYIAEQLTKLGIRLREARVVSDVEAEIVAAVNECRARYDYVFTTGGIGPTHDDITSAAVARAFGVPLILDPRARALLEPHYPPGGLNEARLRMAHVPGGGRSGPESGLRRTGFSHGQCLRAGGRAGGDARHVRWAEGKSPRRPAGALGDGRAPISAKASSPPGWARCRGDIRIWRSAAIPSSAKAAMARASCCAASIMA